MKNEATTTRKPASGPTDRSMAPSNSATVCPSAMNPRAVVSNRMLLILKAEMKLAFLAEDIEPQQDNDQSERNSRRIVPIGGNAARPAVARSSLLLRAARPDMGVGIHGGRDDSGLPIHRSPSRSRRRAPATGRRPCAHNPSSSAASDEVHDHRSAGARYLTQDPVNFRGARRHRRPASARRPR